MLLTAVQNLRALFGQAVISRLLQAQLLQALRQAVNSLVQVLLLMRQVRFHSKM